MSDDGDLIEKTNHVGWPSGDNDNNDVVFWHLLVFKDISSLLSSSCI